MRGIDTYNEISDQMTLAQFVESHKLLVRKIALSLKKKLPHYIELDDLLQSGYIGLIEAKNNYNPDSGTPFDAFASHRIKGSIIDSLRKNSWASRDAIRMKNKIDAAISKLQQENSRDPSSEEIIAELGISQDDYTKYCSLINVSNVMMLDSTEIENVTSQAEENPSRVSEKEQLIELLKSALQALPERDRLVLSLYYMEELTFKDIGKTLDLTEARVCQLHAEAVLKLKCKLKQ